MESPITSSRAVELYSSCSGQAQPNRPETGPGHKNTEPRSIFTILRIPFIIFSFKSRDVKSGKIVQKIPRSWHKRRLDLSLTCEYLRTHLKDRTRYDQGQEIHGEPKRVSLPFDEAQLAGCLKIWVSGPLEWYVGIQ